MNFDNFVITCQKPHHLRDEREASMRRHPKHPGRLKPRQQKALDYLRQVKRLVKPAELAQYLNCAVLTARNDLVALGAAGFTETVRGKNGGTRAKETR